MGSVVSLEWAVGLLGGGSLRQHAGGGEACLLGGLLGSTVSDGRRRAGRPRRSCCASPRRADICARAQVFDHGRSSWSGSGSLCGAAVRWMLRVGARVVAPVPQAATSFLRGRPRGRLRGITTPWRNSSPPQTPQGSRRSRAPARHSARTGQSWQAPWRARRRCGDSAKNSSGLLTRHGSCVLVDLVRGWRASVENADAHLCHLL